MHSRPAARIRPNRTTLWKRRRTSLARGWGRAQSADCPQPRYGCSTIHPRGKTRVSPCESWERIKATRDLCSTCAVLRLLAIQGAAPKPRSPAPNHIIYLLLINNKGEKRGGSDACRPFEHAGRQAVARGAERRAAEPSAGLDDAPGRALPARVSRIAGGEGELSRSRL